MDVQSQATFQKANRNCARALVCLSIALFFFSVGVFFVNPESAIGIISLFIGLAFVVTSWVFFALYGHYSKEQ